MAATLVLVAAGFAAGWFTAFRAAEGRRRRLILRNKGSTPLADIVIQTGNDGAMEFKVSNAQLKKMRRGENVEGLIKGARGEMRVRLSSL